VAKKAWKNLQELSDQELSKKIEEVHLALFEARIQKSTLQLTDTAIFWRLRKSLARMRTLEGMRRGSERKVSVG
jgi:ribosomal protein L29